MKFSNCAATAGAAESSSSMVMTTGAFRNFSETKLGCSVGYEGCARVGDVSGAKPAAFLICGFAGAESGASGVRSGTEYDGDDDAGSTGGAAGLKRCGGADPKLGT